jgi:hypothetical protein
MTVGWLSNAGAHLDKMVKRERWVGLMGHRRPREMRDTLLLVARGAMVPSLPK